MIIKSIWATQPGRFFCVSTKSRSGLWRDEFFSRQELGEIRDYIRGNENKDLYFCPHGFSEKRRHKSVAVAPKLLYADLDEVDPRKLRWKPTIAVESSPGRYVGIWIVDKPINESLNRRLTYAIEADKGGWDFSQVLRVPGTTNYKYDSMPKVRLLWDDGPTYKVAQLERELPADRQRSSGNAREIWKRYEGKLPRWVRRELLHGKPTVGKRSEVLWKIEHALIDAGMSIEEGIAVVKASPWNKYRGRASEDEQLRRDFDKVAGEKLDDSNGEMEHEYNGYKFLQHSMAEITEEKVDWLWYPWLARGEVTLLEGDPGLGKSWVAQMIGKAVCDGEKLPQTRRGLCQLSPGRVAYFDTENDRGRVTLPRLRWNGCKNLANFFQDPQPFSIDDDDSMAEVEKALDICRPDLVVFDTINLYIGGIDTGRANEVTQAMQPFVGIARRYNSAVICIRHLTKGTRGTKALYRGQGNIAFTATCRIQMTIAQDPEDDSRNFLSMTKLNLAPFPKALSFEKHGAPTTRDPDRCLFEWGDWADYTSDELLNVEPVKGEKREDAAEFLRELLADGDEIEVPRIETMAERRAISRRTLHRAAEEIGVKRHISGFGKHKKSCWYLDSSIMPNDKS